MEFKLLPVDIGLSEEIGDREWDYSSVRAIFQPSSSTSILGAKITLHSVWRIGWSGENANFSSLYMNILTHCHHQCRDPRDRVYGLLAISADSEELGVIPEYCKSVTAVFMDATIRSINSWSTLSLFEYASGWDNASH
jgi:hypothetical protein